VALLIPTKFGTSNLLGLGDLVIYEKRHSNLFTGLGGMKCEILGYPTDFSIGF